MHIDLNRCPDGALSLGDYYNESHGLRSSGRIGLGLGFKVQGLEFRVQNLGFGLGWSQCCQVVDGFGSWGLRVSMRYSLHLLGKS